MLLPSSEIGAAVENSRVVLRSNETRSTKNYRSDEMRSWGFLISIFFWAQTRRNDELL